MQNIILFSLLAFWVLQYQSVKSFEKGRWVQVELQLKRLICNLQNFVKSKLIYVAIEYRHRPCWADSCKY